MKAIEESSLNAWPALQQLVFDGWLLRFAKGYTQRANSVHPLYAGWIDQVADKVKRCEQIYSQRQLPTIFKITPFVDPVDLDEMLVWMDYRRESLTSVQGLALTAFNFQEDDSVQRWSSPTDTWLAEFTRLDRRAAANQATLSALLHNIVSPACFALLTHQGRPAACGLAVHEGDFVGLFDIATDPAQRRQGLTTRLISDLLHWAKQQAAATAYLQVMLENEPALRLYEKLGFKELYQYWYRVKS